MKQIQRLVLAASILLSSALLTRTPADDAPPAGEFQPDVHTLFLAHFNDRLDEADYALGVSTFCGNGARPTAGYYGQGIDLRPRGLTPDFAATCNDFTPRYDGWGFRARGNVDPSQGTFASKGPRKVRSVARWWC